MKPLLIIGHTFPEPNTTAAGSRMMQLIALFQEAGFQQPYEYRHPFGPIPNLEAQQISVKNILLNDASFDAFVKDLKPEIVLFDRYITEDINSGGAFQNIARMP